MTRGTGLGFPNFVFLAPLTHMLFMAMRGVGVPNRFIVIEPWSVILYLQVVLGGRSDCGRAIEA